MLVPGKRRSILVNRLPPRIIGCPAAPVALGPARDSFRGRVGDDYFTVGRLADDAFVHRGDDRVVQGFPRAEFDLRPLEFSNIDRRQPQPLQLAVQVEQRFDHPIEVPDRCVERAELRPRGDAKRLFRACDLGQHPQRVRTITSGVSIGGPREPPGNGAELLGESGVDPDVREVAVENRKTGGRLIEERLEHPLVAGPVTFKGCLPGRLRWLCGCPINGVIHCADPFGSRNDPAIGG
jgi:hypothetical protein